jgi:hypothetical protein
MRSLFLASVFGVVLVTGSGSCTKDQPDDDHAATIVFRTDSGYTWRDDTVPLADTLRIGVTVSKGSDDLQLLIADVSYDGGPGIIQDSVPVTSEPFPFEKTLVTRDQAGTEKWTFSVYEYDGDITRRSLTFTVQ